MAKKKLILCVDDEKIVLNSLKEQLINQLPQNYRIDMAQSGQEALEIIEEYASEGYEILLVISDYVMPGMQGDELLKKIHQDHPESVKILLTGQANLDGISNIINQAGLFRYIQKPWQREDLVLATVEAIKSYEKDRTIEEQNKNLLLRNEELLKWASAVVETLSTTLDSRDTTTFGHSHRMADYAVEIANYIKNSKDPYFKDSNFNDNSIEALRIAALLHDVGKIGIREKILLKESRLSKEHMTTLKQKFLFLNCHFKTLAPDALTKDELVFLEKGQTWIKKLEEINSKDYLLTEDLEFVSYLFHNLKFENSVNNQGQSPMGLLNKTEADALSVQYGNLNPDERQVMQSHAQLTYDILSKIPWPTNLGDVAALAASHHERLDGSGYFKGLQDKDICFSTRILGILDVFEALTSQDRPYRKSVSHLQAIKILELEGKQGKMDLKIIEILKLILEIKED